jgi:RimJ/RimL family protein N-acetyltransferase
MPAPFFPPDSITDGDLTIRTYLPGDGPALTAAKNVSYEHLRPWMPWARPDDTAEEDEARVRRFRGNYLLNADFVLSIWLDGAAGPQFAGGTGFHRFNLEAGNAEIGMWMAASFAGQGLGTRALRLMLRWGFTAWPWQRLTWHCDSRNLASIRTAEKAGMILEAVLRRDLIDVDGHRRDTRIYALLKEEWENRPIGAESL